MSTINARLPRLARLIDPSDVRCPAGCPALAGEGVLCRIEGDVIDARRNPSTVTGYCTGNHQACPTWQADKEAHWQKMDLRTELAREGR